jgi:glutamate carboxypeptidase
MKGGIVVILGAIWVLDRLGLLSEVPLALAFNGDEEIGSPHSGPALGKLARDCRLGLIFECGGLAGEVVTSRRGVSRFLLKIRGESGHSGSLERDQENAIVELSRQILKLAGLNAPETGLTVNVGRVQGGTAANIIPGEAEAEFEFRFWQPEKAEEIDNSVQTLIPARIGETLTAQIIKRHSRPAMIRTPATAALYHAASLSADRIRMSLPEEARGGASDANLLAAAGLASLDGLGPIGEMDHSKNERILKDSLFQRVQLLTHLLWDLRTWSSDKQSK